MHHKLLEYNKNCILTNRTFLKELYSVHRKECIDFLKVLFVGLDQH